MALVEMTTTVLPATDMVNVAGEVGSVTCSIDMDTHLHNGADHRRLVSISLIEGHDHDQASSVGGSSATSPTHRAIHRELHDCTVGTVDLGIQELRESIPEERQIVNVADIFSLLGDPARLRILIALSGRRLRVCDLVKVVGASESSVSHALRILRAHRVVDVIRRGREAHYALADSHVRALLELAIDHVNHSPLTLHADSNHDHTSDS